jgi:hypothetical protein
MPATQAAWLSRLDVSYVRNKLCKHLSAIMTPTSAAQGTIVDSPLPPPLLCNKQLKIAGAPSFVLAFTPKEHIAGNVEPKDRS